MLHAHDGIEADAETGGCYDACRRAIIGGQDFFRDRYVNNTNEVKSITLTSRYPGGKLIPIELDGLYQTSTGGMVMKRGAWTASIGRGVDFGVRLAKNLTGGCCAGQGPIFATIGGSGTAFLNGGGTVLEARLRDGERIVLDTDALVACDATVDIGARRAGTAAAMCCGGEGLFVAELTGPGRVIVQSMPIEKAAAQYAKFIKAPAGATAPARPRPRSCALREAMRRRAPPDAAPNRRQRFLHRLQGPVKVWRRMPERTWLSRLCWGQFGRVRSLNGSASCCCPARLFVLPTDALCCCLPHACSKFTSEIFLPTRSNIVSESRP